MIRRLIALVICIYAGFGLNARAEGLGPRWWVGVGGGPSFSRFSFSPSVSQHAMRGYNGGLMLRYDVERGASLQIEALYVRTGFSERHDDVTLSYQRSLTYAELPILAHLYLRKGLLRFFVNVGPTVGYLLGESAVERGSTFSEAEQLRHGLKVDNKIFWGLCGGPGVSLGLGRKHRVEIEGRLVYSYGNIWKSSRTDPYGQSSELRYGASLKYFFAF